MDAKVMKDTEIQYILYSATTGGNTISYTFPKLPKVMLINLSISNGNGKWDVYSGWVDTIVLNTLHLGEYTITGDWTTTSDGIKVTLTASVSRVNITVVGIMY